jgi:biopolymer transport protein ExbB/biopolymer transport protein TolQ
VASYRNPYAIQAVERATKRAEAAVHGDMKRGLNSLATIASTATLIGLLGAVAQMYFHTFYSCGGNWSSCIAPIGGRLAEAMSLAALGLLVAIPAF